MPLVDTINSRLFMAKASFDKRNCGTLYTEEIKELAAHFMNKK